MKKQGKIILAVVVVILVAGVAVLATQTSLLQGRMSLKRYPAYDPAQYYSYKSKRVSVVTSPVTSVVESKVTSKGGTSKVGSAVTSPVASGVPTEQQPDGKGLSSLTKLTKEILETAAREEFKRNPARFTLSQQEKQRILDLYKQRQSVK